MSHRLSSAAASGALALACTAAVASAALPAARARYIGRGEDYLNDAPHWLAARKQPVSFDVSANRRRILAFEGRYFYYCGSGTATLTAAYILVSSSGTFDYRFDQRPPAGGVVYAEIKGRFTDGGRSAQVSYLVNYSEGRPMPRPYSTANPSALGCASWTKAVVHVS